MHVRYIIVCTRLVFTLPVFMLSEMLKQYSLIGPNTCKFRLDKLDKTAICHNVTRYMGLTPARGLMWHYHRI